MREVIALVELRGAKTVTVTDIIYILNRVCAPPLKSGCIYSLVV